MSEIPPQTPLAGIAADCNLSKSSELIGDRRTLLILRSAFWGLRRFDDFRVDIDVPRSVLSNRPPWSRAASWSGTTRQFIGPLPRCA
jgi:DNA-binding HxlR family transcriptional regulator